MALERHREAFDKFVLAYNAWARNANQENQIVRVDSAERGAATGYSLTLRREALTEIRNARKAMQDALDALKDLEKELR